MDLSSEARAQIEEHLLPRDFILSRRQSRDAFLAEFGDTQLLLIQIDEADGELVHGLADASTVSGLRLKPSYDGLGFATVMSGPDDAPKSVRPPGHRFDSTTLETLLVRNSYFVAPLRRRDTGRAFVEHISVGRARNSDIVLRHDSVSKFHAWFECDDEGNFYVGDAKSKNGTRVNGVRVAGSDLVPLDSGVEIRFGRIATVLCPPETFWRAIDR
jgi:FHA domain